MGLGSRRNLLAAAGAVVVLLASAGVGLAAVLGGSPAPPPRSPSAAPSPAHRSAATATSAPVPAQITVPSTTAPPTTTPPPVPAAAATTLPLPGCPPPPFHGPPPTPPWHPAHLVPDSALPPAPGPLPRRASLAPIAGKGMWIWQAAATEGGDVSRIVSAARAAGLHQIWVRVADSQNGFYGASLLDRLVPAAHRSGLAVIGWGFPYLFDPVADARWTDAALSWTGPGGSRLDGWSADIETSSEGVALSPQRVAVYLGRVRHDNPSALVVATVFPPTDAQWRRYPFTTMAPYVDAYAPMVYWGCDQPVAAAEAAVARLSPYAPVHLIGQAYDMGPYGGRLGPPTPAEITAFMQAGRTHGAVGASFWSWQSIDAADWNAVSAFRW